MSKRISPFISLLLAVVITVCGLFLEGSSGTSAQRAAVAGGTSRSAAIVATTQELLRETSEIRELEILRPVKSGAQSRAEIERMLIKKLNEQTNQDEMRATEVTLRKFGLVPEGFEYRPFIIKLLTEQVAGYYDAKAREFYLADWIELEGQKPVMAHELTHALQDQHFNLRRFEKWPDGDSDAELAAHALIEGDATLAMTLYMIKNPLVALAFTRSLSGLSATSKEFNDAPRALRETLIFPYSQGAEWATSVYKRGGWKMVSGAFTKLPQSTEQILHPEKYVSYEAPVNVALTDITEWLNENRKLEAYSRHHAVSRNQQTGDSKPAEKPGATRRNVRSKKPSEAKAESPTVLDTRRSAAKWRRIDYDVNGEWSYYLLLDEFLKESITSKRAAAGWAGDRYAVYENPGLGQVLVTHVSQWDTQSDAQEFFNAYVKRTALRYPGATLIPNGSPNDSIRRWQTSEGGVVIELRGSRVVVLEGIPTGLDPVSLGKLVG
ncbi:MAG TPA: hypothetical protein VJU86_01110 [Pyrinomonadaceae bacterium]|nr:hypothetical protein [Pyrinomonadaceae bacterium]